MLFNNFVLLEGRLTQKPEIKKTKNDKPYLRCCICYNEGRKLPQKDSNGNEWINVPHFFHCIAWNKNAEFLAGCETGTPLSITGKLNYSEWTEDDGSRRNEVSIIITSAKKIAIEKKETETPEIDEVPEFPADEQIPFD